MHCISRMVAVVAPRNRIYRLLILVHEQHGTGRFREMVQSAGPSGGDRASSASADVQDCRVEGHVGVVVRVLNAVFL